MNRPSKIREILLYHDKIIKVRSLENLRNAGFLLGPTLQETHQGICRCKSPIWVEITTSTWPTNDHTSLEVHYPARPQAYPQIVMQKSSKKSIWTSAPALPDTVDSHVELAKNRVIRKTHKRSAEKVTKAYPSSAQMTLGSGAPPGKLINLMFFVCRQVSTKTKNTHTRYQTYNS